MRAYVQASYPNGSIFVPLPRALWRSCNGCAGECCAGREAHWDTLALPPPTPRNKEFRRDTPYTVHWPELHRGDPDAVEVEVDAALRVRIDAGLREVEEINRRLSRADT